MDITVVQIKAALIKKTKTGANLYSVDCTTSLFWHEAFWVQSNVFMHFSNRQKPLDRWETDNAIPVKVLQCCITTQFAITFLMRCPLPFGVLIFHNPLLDFWFFLFSSNPLLPNSHHFSDIIPSTDTNITVLIPFFTRTMMLSYYAVTLYGYL